MKYTKPDKGTGTCLAAGASAARFREKSLTGLTD